MGVEAIRWNLQLLKRDETIVLFPEGTRSHGEGMKRAHPGVAYLAARSQAPILPVAITGTEKIRGYWQMPFPLCRVKVRIGQPFSLPVMEGKLSRPVLEHLADMIMQRIADILPEGYREPTVPPRRGAPSAQTFDELPAKERSNAEQFQVRHLPQSA